MSFRQYRIEDADFQGKGISPLPAYPQLRTPQMQQKFDELVKDVVTPKHNALAEALAGANAAADIGVQLQGIAADNVAEALAYLAGVQDIPQPLPEEGDAGMLLYKTEQGALWKKPFAADIALEDAAQLFAAATLEEALQEAGSGIAAAMPRAGGTFTGNAAAYSENRTGEALRNIEVVSGSIEEPAAVSTNKIVMVRK